MPFNFRHSPSRKKEPRSWYENALLLAAAGSIIAVIGQLAGTVIPIMYGPQDISDFSIDINDDVYQIIDVNTTSEGRDVNVGIAVEDLHQSLRPYTFKIQFKAVGPINDTTAIFDPPEIKLQRRFGFLEFLFPLKSVPSKFKYRKPYENLTPNESNFTEQREYLNLTPYECILTITTNCRSIGTYPIIIQGIGNNGKIHNTTLYLRILNHQDYLKYVNDNLDVAGNKIGI